MRIFIIIYLDISKWKRADMGFLYYCLKTPAMSNFNRNIWDHSDIKDGEGGKKKFKKDDDKTPVMHFSNLVSSMQLIVSNQSSIVVLLNTWM